MPRPTRLALATVVATLAIAWTTPATASPLATDGATCVVHRGAVGRANGHPIRDLITTSGPDKLSRWIRRHPVLARTAANRTFATTTPVAIPVAFHVLRRGMKLAGGNIPRGWILAQLAVLNDAYSGVTGGADTGIQFTLASVDRTTDPVWFEQTSSAERKMKAALKVGGLDTLNMYSADLGPSLLGWAYLAQDAASVGVLDGVVLHYKTLPGGPWGVHYSQGDTATHEVGHWLNLLHTFKGGCNDGDLVDDTPAEASPAFQCPTGRDSCPAVGEDPITNFMDYTYDSCMDQFTDGQGVRMQQAWTAFRAPV
jgi:Pregnancy-associated plasma protein-A